MRFTHLAISCIIFLMIGAGCDSNQDNPFFVEEIPPPSEIADSLYTITPSGLKYFDLQEGLGAVADVGLAVEYHYILWLSDSTMVNSSYLFGRPQVIVLGEDDGLIPGWSEGFVGMRAGGFRQLIIPPDLAYGESGSPQLAVPPNETVLMELALLNVGAVVDDVEG